MNPLNMLFGQLVNSVQQHSARDTPGPEYDANPVIGALSNIFGQHAQQTGQQFDGYNPNAQYENRGPDLGGILGGLLGGGQQNDGGQQNYGGQQGYGNVLSSDADPYGDPENQGGARSGNAGFGNVLSSDADPYGDPENQR